MDQVEVVVRRTPGLDPRHTCLGPHGHLAVPHRKAEQSPCLLHVAPATAGQSPADGQHRDDRDHPAGPDQEVTAAQVGGLVGGDLAEQRRGDHPQGDDPGHQPDHQGEARTDAGLRQPQDGEQAEHRQREEHQVREQRVPAHQGGGVRADPEYDDGRAPDQQGLVEGPDQMDQEDGERTGGEVPHCDGHGLDRAGLGPQGGGRGLAQRDARRPGDHARERQSPPGRICRPLARAVA